MRFSLAVALPLFFSAYAHAFNNYPCDGAPGAYRTNPDSSAGGFVATSATVESTVVMSVGSSVCDYAKLNGKVVLQDTAIVRGRATVKGNVQIKQEAVVEGDVQITNTDTAPVSVISENARIYGSATLMGSVSVQGTSEVYGLAALSGRVQVKGDSRVCGLAILRMPIVIENSQEYCEE